MSEIDAKFFRAWAPEEVAAQFLAELIHFRSYTRINGEYEKTDLISNMEYPFITEYLDKCIFYVANTFPGSELVKSFTIETLTDIDVIENIGSHLKYTHQYYEDYKQGTMRKLHIEEIDFIFIQLLSLSKVLQKIYNKINRYITRTDKLIKNLNTSKIVAEKNIADLQKQKDTLRKQYKKLTAEDEKKLNENSVSAFYSEDEIKRINKFMILCKKQFTVINDRVTLVSSMLNYCRYEMQTRARQSFSERLDNRMKARNISSDDIENILKIKQQTFSDYTKSKTLPENMKLIVLAKTLDCSIDYLLGLSDTLDYRAYRSHFAFKKLGFSEDAFNNMIELRHNHALAYSEAISTINTLLEESDISTLSYISKYLAHNNLNDYLTIKKEDIDNLQDDITDLANAGATADEINEVIKHFKQNLPNQTISVDESNIMLNIQHNLTDLKTANAGYYNSRVGELYGNLWVSGHYNNPLGHYTAFEEDEDEDIDESELEEYDYNDSVYDYHPEKNDYSLDIEEYKEEEQIDYKDKSLPFNE